MRSSFRELLFVASLAALPCGIVEADITLPSVIGSHMVLQRDQPIPVWGTAAPGEVVSVTFASGSFNAKADSAGHWQVALPKHAASSQPQSMLIEGSNGAKIQLTDILVGEVWFCTGPSNIYWQVEKCDNAKKEISQADFPCIRFFTVEKNTADEPQDNCAGHWFGCTPDTVGEVSGVGYFFSRRIHDELDMPIGLLQSFWGGSRIEAWTSRSALEADPSSKPVLDWWSGEFQRFNLPEEQALYKKRLEAWNKAAARATSEGSSPPKRPAAPEDPRNSRHRPACLYNGMVAPLIPFSIRGVICYQGLGNLFWAEHSADLLDIMIRDWRTRWAQGDFPIGLVQPAPFDCTNRPKSGPDAYSLQREAQLIVQGRHSNIGIAPTLDVDAVDVLHFTNKQLVAKRLSSWALATVYGFDIPHAGPVFESIDIEGGSIRVHFRNTGSGLTTSDGRAPAHFQIAGDDGEYYPAEAIIEGHTVLVHSEHVKKPRRLRFAFSDTAVVNLINREGLPASLFRTDVQVDRHTPSRP